MVPNAFSETEASEGTCRASLTRSGRASPVSPWSHHDACGTEALADRVLVYGEASGDLNCRLSCLVALDCLVHILGPELAMSSRNACTSKVSLDGVLVDAKLGR